MAYQARHAQAPRPGRGRDIAIAGLSGALILSVATGPIPKITFASEPSPVAVTQPDMRLDLSGAKRAAARNRELTQDHARHAAKSRAGRHRQAPRKHYREPIYRSVFSGNLTESQLAALWIKAGGNPSYAHIASAIAMAESSGRQHAHSGTNDVGYWQINGSSWGRLATYDPIGNAKAAILISHNGRSWYDWTTFTSGAYLRYM